LLALFEFYGPVCRGQDLLCWLHWVGRQGLGPPPARRFVLAKQNKTPFCTENPTRRRLQKVIHYTKTYKFNKIFSFYTFLCGKARKGLMHPPPHLLHRRFTSGHTKK